MARRYHEIKGLAEFTAKTIVSDKEQGKAANAYRTLTEEVMDRG